MDDDDTLDTREALGDDDAPEASAVALLTQDHDELRQVFQDYAALGDADSERDAKQSLLDGLLQLLEAQLAVEEEIFYPAVSVALDDPDLARAALAEHAEIDALMRELRQTKTPPDARVHALQSLVEGHIDTVERELFPLTEDVFEDVDSPCQQMRERKEEVESEHAAAAAQRRAK
jgi:hemerythrin-like domain-containing protein